jgi:hypothetical protein
MSMTINAKCKLVLDTVRLCLRQEFRGYVLDEYRPKVTLIIRTNDPPDVSVYTDIGLDYSKLSSVPPDVSNWGGLGDSLKDSLDSNLLSFRYELQARLAEYQKALEQVNQALSTSKFKYLL